MTLLPTPTTSDTNGAGAHGVGGADLRTTVSLLPTPRASDGEKGGPNQRGSSGDLMLPSAVAQLLPTPTARDGKDGQIRREPHRPNDTDTLARALTVLLPTPTTADHKASGSAGYGGNEFCTLTDATVRQPDRWGQYAPAIARWEAILGRPAPAPTMTSAKGNPQLAPRFVEWMMGLPEGWVDDVPDLTRNEKLKALGNGVVTQQAVEGVRRLLALTERGAA